MNKSLGIRDGYKFYRKENRDGVLLHDYLNIVSGYNSFIADKIISGDCVQLPERLGDLQCIGTKTKPRIDENGNIQGLSPAWKKTMELWNSNPLAKEKKEIVFHFNEATQGIRYSVRWSKNKVFVKNKDYYSFRLTFTNREKLSKTINDGTEYFVRNNNMKS